MKLVRDIMSAPPITVTAEAHIRAVAGVLRANLISGVPVVDDAGNLLGVITELDLIARNAPLEEPHYIAVLSAYIPVGIKEHRQYKEHLRQALAVHAAELMQTNVKTVAPNASAEEALKLMLDPVVTMLPVMENGRLMGVVTRTDIVRMIEELEMAPDEPPG